MVAIADRIAAQAAEFDALIQVWKALKALPPIVDDNYEEYRVRYEGAVHAFIRRLIDNGRIALTFSEFAQANKARCVSHIGFNHELKAWSASDWMTALCGEVGEAANVVKKMNRVRDGMGHRNKEAPGHLQAMLKAELGDVGCYLDLVCQALGTTMEECIREAFNNKSKEIGCPIIV
jgi:NTP pyrophosphatase (non-canonical NTP hydrolase)